MVSVLPPGSHGAHAVSQGGRHDHGYDDNGSLPGGRPPAPAQPAAQVQGAGSGEEDTST